MHRRLLLRVAAVLVLIGAAACGDDTEPTTPTEPTRPTTTETFPGRLTVNGAATHPFVAGGSGQISVTLTSLSPESTARISLSLGTFNQTGACAIFMANDNATQSTSVIANATAAGTFCARVSDVGQLTAPTDYTLTVVHF